MRGWGLLLALLLPIAAAAQTIGPGGGGGSGTVTSVTCGTGLTGGTITTTGTCAADFGTATNKVAEGGVITAGGPTGSATVVPVITYNAAGQLTAVTTANIVAPAASVTPGTTTVVGATAPCIIDNSTSSTMGCGALGTGLALNSGTFNTTYPVEAAQISSFAVASTDMGTTTPINISGGGTITLPLSGAFSTVFAAGQTWCGQNIGATADTITNSTGGTMYPSVASLQPSDTICVGSDGTSLYAAINPTTATGTGSVVRATSPTLVTPTLGAATATSINGNTFTTGTYTLTGTAAKTLNFTNTLTLSGTDSTTMTFPGSSTTLAGLAIAESFTAPQRTNTETPAISTATFTPVFSTGQNHRIVLVHASCPCTLANPAAIVAGQSGVFEIVQSATGSDTITTWGSEYEYAGGTATITLSTTANAADYIPYYVDSTGSFIVLGGIILKPVH